MTVSVIAPALLAFIAAVGLSLIGLQIFPKLGLMDFPERYGMSRQRLPYPFGIIGVLVFIAAFSILEPQNSRSLGVLAAVALLAFTCFIDDRRPLPSVLRLSVQLIAGGIVFAAGDCLGGRICSVTNPLEGFVGGPIIELNGAVPIAGLAVTVVWLLLTTNALNWFDGIPGQVNAVSCVGFATIGALALSDRVGQPSLATLAFVLSAIALAGLLFDWPPPRVVLGDSGAMVYGLLIGILTIYAGGKVATAFLVLGVPLMDSILVIARRLLSGASPLKGGQDHLHHRLLKRGWSPHAVILLSVAIGGVFGISALFFSTIQKFVAAVVLAAAMIALSVYADRR